jgi:hypothetical protein
MPIVNTRAAFQYQNEDTVMQEILRQIEQLIHEYPTRWNDLHEFRILLEQLRAAIEEDSHLPCKVTFRHDGDTVLISASQNSNFPGYIVRISISNH